MPTHCRSACIPVALYCLACQPTADRPLTPDEESTIATIVGSHFDGIATVTNNLQFDSLLGFYSERDDLTYVARGRITRSHATFAELVNTQFAGVSDAMLSFSDKYVDVLERDVAVVTARFQFAATVGGRDTARSSGTFTCVYVLRDGLWKIQHSSHTFPAGL